MSPSLAVRVIILQLPGCSPAPTRSSASEGNARIRQCKSKATQESGLNGQSRSEQIADNTLAACRQNLLVALCNFFPLLFSHLSVVAPGENQPSQGLFKACSLTRVSPAWRRHFICTDQQDDRSAISIHDLESQEWTLWTCGSRLG